MRGAAFSLLVIIAAPGLAQAGSVRVRSTSTSTPTLPVSAKDQPLAPLAPALALPPATVEPQTPALAPSENLPVSLKVAHSFTRDLARERIGQLLQYWSDRFGVKAEWQGFRVFLSGQVLGIDIQAFFDVDEHEVQALARDPGTVLRGTAERYVERKLRKYLNPNYDEP